MMIDTIELDDDFELQNPYWTGFAASREYASNGALLVEIAEMQAGQPLVLLSGDHWLKKSVLDALKAHSKLGLESFTVVLPGGQEHTAMWDYTEGDPIQSQPVIRETYPTPDSRHTNVVLKLITV